MTNAPAIRTDQTPTTTELTARDVFNIWLADQSELTRTVYRAEVTAFLEWAGKPAQDYTLGTS